MGNAIKFTEKGEIELSLEVDEDWDNKIKLHVKVRDTGIGISKEKLEMVFDRFRTVEDTHTREFGGTGLGLTISKNIYFIEEWKPGLKLNIFVYI